MNTCPTASELRQALRDDVLSDESGSISQHLGHCQRCQDELERQMAGASDLIALSTTSDDAEEYVAPVVWTDDLSDRLANRVCESLESDAEVRAEFPQQLGDYEILDLIGEGGMGYVFRARQRQLNRIVALKVVRRRFFGKSANVRRFRVEAESVAQLDHPGIVSVYDVGEEGSYVFYAMAYLPGGTLADFHGSSATHRETSGASTRYSPDTSDWKHSAELVQSIAQAISHAHSCGIVHRDLKPSNILLSESNEPKIADFGLAKRLLDSDDLTATGEVLGTPAYMSPEQAKGHGNSANVLSDIYGVGAILYYLLTGNPPFPSDDPSTVIYRVIHDPVVPVRNRVQSVPEDLAVIAEKCLSKVPRDRYLTADDLADDLGRFLRGEPIDARPIGTARRWVRWTRTHPLMASLCILILCVTFVGSTVSTYYWWLATLRSDQLISKNLDLENAISLADRSVIAAQRETEAAKKQADGAIELLEEMLFKVQASYVNDPAAQEQRRSLIKTVIKRLDSIPVQYVGDLRIERCRANAMRYMAEVVMQSGDDNGLTGVSGAKVYHETAVGVLRNLHQKAPEDQAIGADLAETLVEFADTLGYANLWKEGHQALEEAVPLVQKLIESNPDDWVVRHLMADTMWLKGETLTNLNCMDEGKQHLLIGLRLYNELKDDGDTSFDNLEGICKAQRELGDWYLKNKDFKGAEEAFRETLMATEALMNRFPLNSNAIMDHGSSHERLGDLLQQQGRLSEALKHHEEGLELVEVLRFDSPGNVFVAWQVSFAYQRLAKICQLTGDLKRARTQGEKCVEVRLQTVSSDPMNRLYRSKLVKSLRTLASICREQSDYAREVEVLTLAESQLAILKPGNVDEQVAEQLRNARAKLDG